MFSQFICAVHSCSSFIFIAVSYSVNMSQIFLLSMGYVGYMSYFPGSSDGKESGCNAGDLGWIPGSKRFSGEGNVYPLQYSGLENSMDIVAWQATVHGVVKSQTRLSNFFSFLSSLELLAHVLWCVCVRACVWLFLRHIPRNEVTRS